jgi:hypothetical protein
MNVGRGNRSTRGKPAPDSTLQHLSTSVLPSWCSFLVSAILLKGLRCQRFGGIRRLHPQGLSDWGGNDELRQLTVLLASSPF